MTSVLGRLVCVKCLFVLMFETAITGILLTISHAHASLSDLGQTHNNNNNSYFVLH